MKILYGIFTCEKYLNTRCEWIKDTWLKNIDIEDNYFFIAHDNIGDKIIGFNVKDDYKNLPYKFIEYIKYVGENFIDKYDWFHFSDDDCYIYPDRLKSLLKEYINEKFCISCRYGYLKDVIGLDLINVGMNYNSIYPGGGASFTLNRETLKKLNNYLCETKDIFIHHNSDVSFGIWLNKCGMNNYKHSEYLGYTNPTELGHDTDRIKKNITYHYCNKETFYYLEKIK